MSHNNCPLTIHVTVLWLSNVMPYTTHFFFATHRNYVPFKLDIYRNTHSGKGQLNISSQHGNIVNEMYRDTVVALLHNTKNTGLFSLVSVQIQAQPFIPSNRTTDPFTAVLNKFSVFSYKFYQCLKFKDALLDLEILQKQYTCIALNAEKFPIYPFINLGVEITIVILCMTYF